MKTRSPRTSRRGFALLITITLLAFLVLLLVSLATLTRVETQVATNSQQLSQARQNALMGLNIALGQLQAFAGPDQRATARADRAADSVDGARMWTGVWGNANPSSTATGKPILLNWLVSGNEGQTVTAKESGADFGQITAPTGDATPAYGPATVISPALTTSVTATTNLQIGAQPARLLIGPGTAGTATGAEKGYVAAPLMPVKAQVPGLGSTPLVVGNYGWWVGDEGVKARINLVNPWPESAATATDANIQANWSFATAQRTAGELMANFSTLPVNGASLEKALSPNQLPLVAPGLGDPAKAGYNDYSMVSEGVLADSRQGGLKRDLTRVLEPGGGDSDEADDQFIFPSADGNSGPFYLKPPTWGLLRDFADTGHTAPSALAPQTPTATRQGIHPVLLAFEIFYTLQVKVDPNDATRQIATMNITPRVVLWNPYNRPFAAGTYELGFAGPRRSTGAAGTMKITTDTGEVIYFNLGSNQFESTPTAARTFLRLQVVMSRPWQPGEAVGFRLPDGTSGLVANPTLVNAGESTNESLEVATWTVGKAAHYTVDMSSANSDIAAANNGVSDLYLGEAGAGDNVAAILAPSGFSNDYYQWIGRVGMVIRGNKFASQVIDVPSTMAVGDPEVQPVANLTVYNGLSCQGNEMPALPARWIAAANARAYMIDRTGLDRGASNQNIVNPLFFSLLVSGNVSPMPGMTGWRGADGEVYVGQDYNGSSATRPVLFELPVSGQPLFSIADLQHAALSRRVTSPSYAVGNSVADFRIDPTDTGVSVTAGWSDANDFSNNPGAQYLYDQSYLLNRALWDRYYFSTVPASGALPEKLPDSRYHYCPAAGAAPAPNELRDAAEAAAGLLVSGSFNVNSVSTQAWRAVLAGLCGLALKYDPATGGMVSDSGSSLGNAFSRFRTPLSGANAVWKGFRELTPGQLNHLADCVVAEVKARGPFVSLADFINRTPGGSGVQVLKGALQAAIDDEAVANAASKINYSAAGSGATVPDRQIDLRGLALVNGTGVSGVSYYTNGSQLKALYGSASGSSGKPYAVRSAFAPGYLTQADVLRSIGATLSARSDTFVIRAYGDAVNPATGVPVGRAWCEAVVQRRPEYVEDADAAWTAPASLTSATNRRFGRRFVIVSFRWLSAEDI